MKKLINKTVLTLACFVGFLSVSYGQNLKDSISVTKFVRNDSTFLSLFFRSPNISERLDTLRFLLGNQEDGYETLNKIGVNTIDNTCEYSSAFSFGESRNKCVEFKKDTSYFNGEIINIDAYDFFRVEIYVSNWPQTSQVASVSYSDDYSNVFTNPKYFFFDQLTSLENEQSTTFNVFKIDNVLNIIPNEAIDFMNIKVFDSNGRIVHTESLSNINKGETFDINTKNVINIIVIETNKNVTKYVTY
jgi:hypothetical protein